MSVQFEKGSYFLAATNDANFKDQKSICQFAHAHPQFKYSAVSYQDFSDHYKRDTKGIWITKKIVAIPNALISGAVFTIYHLAKAVLLGVPKAISGNPLYMKAQVFSAVRDLQQSMGYIISLFNLRYGEYHIQESCFHKSCYNCFTITPEPTISHHEADIGDSVPKRNIPQKPKQENPPRKIDSHSDISSKSEEIQTELGSTKEAIQQKNSPLAPKPYSEDLETAIKEIKSKYRGYKDRELQYVKLANKYLLDEEREKAHKVILEIIFDTTAKEVFLEELAEDYLQDKQPADALKVLQDISSNTKGKEALFVKIIQSYFNDKDENGVLQAIKEIVKSSLQRLASKLSLEKQFSNQLKTNDKANEYLDSLANDCLDKAREHFEQKQTGAAVDICKLQCTEEILQTYLKQ